MYAILGLMSKTEWKGAFLDYKKKDRKRVTIDRCGKPGNKNLFSR